MNISAIFVWFYCLPMHEAVCILFAAALLFRCLDQRFSGQRLWRLGLAAAMVLWIGVVLYVIILSRQPKIAAPAFSLIPLHSYREVAAGGDPEILRSNFMNVALFFPAGLLLGGLLPRRWALPYSVLAVLVLSACFSLALEHVQFTRLLGRGEIDDVIHNTLGAVLGGLTASLETGIVPVPKGRNAQDRTC